MKSGNRTLRTLVAASALWVLVTAGASACQPVEGQVVRLTGGVVGDIEASQDFDSGRDIWFVNVKWGESSNGCLIDAIQVTNAPPNTCKIDSKFEAQGTLEIVPDLVAGGETFNIVVPELICK
jgi:hypothetical protein